MFRIAALLVGVFALAAALLALNGHDMADMLGGAGDSAPVSKSAAPAPSPDGSSAAPAIAAREVSQKTDLFSFSYSYPAQAAAIPALAAVFDQRVEDSRAKREAEAKESRKDAKANGYPFQPHYFEAGWTVSADLPRWLALGTSIQTYGGGAHPNHDFASLVWDRKAGRALDPLDLFVSADALDAALHVRYCAALDKERAERREQSIEEVRHDDIWACPGVADLALVLESKEGKGFDTLSLLAAPYIAGPYVEGSYETELPVDKAVLDAVRPEYREAFRAGR